MENRNTLDSMIQYTVSKRELIDAIRRTFPDDEVGYDGKIAQVTITEMTNGTKMQSVCFGKILNFKID